MIDLLLNKLKEHKEIFAYEIYNVQKDGRELFYVLNKLELNRAVKTKNISCNIYVRDGDKQGSSLINIVAFDDEKSIEEKIWRKSGSLNRNETSGFFVLFVTLL